MLVGCYWCISILIIVVVVRWCSLIGPYKSAVVLFDCGYPSFRNFYIFDPRCITVGVMINKLNLLQIGIYPIFFTCSETTEVWVRANHMSLSCSFFLSHIDLLVSPIYTLHMQMGSCKRHLLVLLVPGPLQVVLGLQQRCLSVSVLQRLLKICHSVVLDVTDLPLS